MGTNIDGELAVVAVPRLADAVAIDLLEPLVLGEQPTRPARCLTGVRPSNIWPGQTQQNSLQFNRYVRQGTEVISAKLAAVI